ncbi:MAG: DUF3987 domain-containing protein [Methyloceanibacter sp.]|nr:DUF3987 domain-containing protein [Methyloceanibacter sp.]
MGGLLRRAGYAGGGGVSFEPPSAFRGAARVFQLFCSNWASARHGSNVQPPDSKLGAGGISLFYKKCVSGGLSSGEGLIDRVRDPRIKVNKKTGEEEVEDAGVEDKRLAVIEPELASILAVMERAGNTISPIIRNAWDGGDLAIMTRKNPIKATAPHISVIAHITVDELRSCLTRTDAASGFANRFLFALARRSKLLPLGGNLSSREIANLGREMAECLRALFDEIQVKFSDDAKRRWAEAYPELTEARPGMLGAVTARGSAQVLRIALVYAILDTKMTIEVEHIEAALAV